MLKKSLIILTLIFFCVSISFAADKAKYGKINFKTGTVKIKRLSGKTESAKVGSKVYVGDKVRTGKKSTAQIILGKNIRTRLAESSEFEIKSRNVNDNGEGKTVLGLSTGKMWTSMKKLKKDDSMSIETPTAVAGIRGTTFVVNQTEEGTDLYVGEGVVNFLSKLLNKDLDVEKDIVVSIDKDGNISEPREMTDADRKKMMSGIPVFIKSKDSDKKRKKDLLKSEINDEKRKLLQESQYANRLQKEDLSTGRTMKDIHGNTVRVEQIFAKTGPKSFQVINLTLRDKSLSFFDITFYYNKELPENFKNWGEFFGDDDVNLNKRLALLGSKTKSGTDDLIKWTGTYDKANDEFNEKFEINGNTYYGNLDDTEENDMSTDKLETVTKVKLYNNPAMEEVNYTGKTLKISLYIINNDGEILGEKQFQSEGDILNLFSTTGAEMIFEADDLNDDIDIVTIPDIGFVIIQEIL